MQKRAPFGGALFISVSGLYEWICARSAMVAIQCNPEIIEIS
jgi:hypothetical protein